MVVSMVLVVVLPVVLTVAYGQVTVVAVETTVVTAPTLWLPGARSVVAAPQTVVVSETVRVVAGMV